MLRAEHNPHESSYKFVRPHKEELFKRKYAGGERYLSVDRFSDRNFRRLEVLSDFLFQRHSRCRRRIRCKTARILDLEIHRSRLSYARRRPPFRGDASQIASKI